MVVGFHAKNRQLATNNQKNILSACN